MIEATCAACGTVARIAESDVPVGAKFVTCASCKARVPLPGQAATATPAKGVAVKNVSIPSLPPRVPPPVPTAKKSDADLADLPAPKRTSPLGGAEPSKSAPRAALAGAELPAPKTAAKPPAPAPGALDLDDLMPADLPAPKARPDAGLADLPAPKPKASALGDLPAGKGKQASALADLPTPKPKPAALADLPAPKPKSDALSDLPAPKKAGPVAKAPAIDDELDLPMPKPGANNDLPAPKGFFDDLPQPAKGGAAKGPATQEVAPKGFFDDLPQPAKGGAARGAGTQEVAPKGFFDDLPQPAKGGAAKGPATQEVAPKGFFDDLPQPAKSGGKAAGLFDDLPQPTKGAAASPGLFDDLPQPSTSAEIPLGGGDLELGQGNALDFGAGGTPDLDLGLPLGESGGFQDLDLGEPIKRGGPAAPAEEPSPIKIKTPAKGAAPAKPIQINVPKDPRAAAADLKLDLADDPHGGPPAAAATAKGGTAVAAKKKGPTPEEAAEVRAAKRKRARIVLGSVLGLAVLGAGGLFMYRRHEKQKARQEQIDSGITSARGLLKAEAPSHWNGAAAQAQQVIDVDPNNTVALGLAAEAAFAGALDTGVNGPTRIGQGRKLLNDGLGAGKITKELERAQALSYIAANQSDKAIPRLQTLIGQEPNDGWLKLYLGWAELGVGDADAALKAFEQASTTKAAKIPALYGHGRAKLMQADVAAARTDFETILQTVKADDPRSVCPQVQLAATLEPSKAAQRDADLKGILERKDVKNKQADPRCITQVYVLLGDVAADNGRLDIARENYRKAIASSKDDIDAIVGQARVELHDNKLQVAADLVQKATAANANHPHTQLVTAELLVAQGKLPDAQKQIQMLAERKPPLTTLDHAQLQVIQGKLLVAQGKPDEAVDAYTEGAKLAGELDLTPTMAAVTLLTDLAKKTTDEAKAADYRKRADALLSAFATRAQDDPQLSTQLGVAYLQAGDPAKAETFLQRAVAMKDDDPDAKVSLGMALSALGRTDEAITQINNAIKIDSKRVDFQLQLALTYQAAGRNDDAIKAYETLLALPDVPVPVRANAGRFFVRLGLAANKPELIDKGAAQAEPILKAEADNPAGLYLKGEGLLRKGKFDEATPALIKATDIDPDAQYLDALGRAYEGRITNDRKFIEAARNAYERATKQDPKHVHAMIGLGLTNRLQDHNDLAVIVLTKANELAPGNPEIQYNLGEAYYGLHNVDAKYAKVGAEWLDAALKGQPELPLDRRAETAHDLGQLYDQLNKVAQCAAAWETAQALGEQMIKDLGEQAALDKMAWFVEGYYYLGDTYEKMNNPPAQKKVWQKYLEHSPKDQTHVSAVNQALATRLQRF